MDSYQYGVPQHDRSGLIVGEAELQAREEHDAAATAVETPMIQGLASYVRRCWQAAREAREREFTARLYKCLRQRKGEHDPDVSAAIAEKGGSSVYMMLTDEKCTAAESWLEDILLPPDDRPWMVVSTPSPDLPAEVIQGIEQQVVQQAQRFIQRHGVEPTRDDMYALMEEIAEKTQAMEKKKARREAEKAEQEIDDILKEGKWREALKKFIYFFVTFPVAYLKGPILRMRPRLVWSEEGPTVSEELVKEFDAPNPFDIYWSPGIDDIDDGYMIERHRMSRADLFSLIEADAGYDEDSIRQVLSEHTGARSTWLWVDDDQRARMEGKHGIDYAEPESGIDALQFWGSVSGRDLMLWSGWAEGEGMLLDPEREYSAEIWLIDRHVIKAVLNPDPLGRKPYYKACFREMVGHWAGKALPEVIRDSQLICNSAAINMVDNMAVAGGPQIGVDAAAMPQGEDYSKIVPWRVWPFDLQNMANTGQRAPIWFFQPKLLAHELFQVYEKFSAEADTKSGIPRYSYGHKETGGPMSTATGFSMMMKNMAKGIQKVIRNIDFGVVAPSVVRIYEWLMLYDEEFRAHHQGDINIIARGSSALITKELSQLRLMEVLQMVLQSPQLNELTGLSGVADIFRKILQGVDIGVDDVVPSDMEIQAIEAAMKAALQQQQQAQLPGPPMGREQQGPARRPPHA